MTYKAFRKFFKFSSPSEKRLALFLVLIIITAGSFVLYTLLPAPRQTVTENPARFNFPSAQELPRIEKALKDLAIIRNAVDKLAADTGSWPGGCIAGKGADPEIWDLKSKDAGLLFPPEDEGSSTCTWSQTAKAKWNGPYLTEVPMDPWGRNYWFDPDYWGRRDGAPRGCGWLYDGVAVGSFGSDSQEYDCSDVVLMLYLPPR